MKTYNLVIFGVKETTRILAEYLHSQGIKIDLLVSIDKSLLAYQDIANYEDLKHTAKAIGATYYCVKEYSLKNREDTFFQDHQFVTGIVYGWQRLIPEAILKVFRVGVFGFHASPSLLPQGKGRSPLNWGLILGKTKLYNHCFKYDVGADSGDIYSVMEFAITPYDTILTLLYKSLLTAKKQVLNLLGAIERGNLKLTPQSGESYFFSKRTPEDGLIHFETHNTSEVVNLIRGVTKPFSGAFCYSHKNKKIIIWEAWPFDEMLDFSAYQPGEVIDTLYNMPVVKTIDGSIILKNYEGLVLKAHDVLTKGYNSL
jgi:methionyl-tRNA formyltransferase